MTPPKSSIRHGSTQRGQSASTPLENKGSLDTSKNRKMPGKGSRVPSGPWGRLKPVDQDPLESMGLPSKGDNRLLDFKAQEKYYTKIVDRYLSCCTEAGKREELLKRFAAMELSEASKPSKPPEHADPSSLIKSKGKDLHHDSALKAKGKDKDIPRLSTEEAQNPANTKALSDVMMALRKLREGIVASDRKDDFAVQTYLFNIRLSILIKNPDSYHPAILYLLKKLHEARPLKPIELAEVVSYLILDTACRRKELAEAFSLRQRYGLKDKHIDAVLGALVHDNYVQFRKVKRVVDGHKSKLMEFAEADMRLLTLKCFGRTYLGCDAQFLEAMAGKKWDDLVKDDSVGWERDGEKIVIRRVKR